MEKISLTHLLSEADLYFEWHDWPKALEFYIQAGKLEPNNPDLLVKIGRCFQKLDKLQEAQRLYDKALSIVPESGEILSDMATAMYQNGELDKAEATFELALVYAPNQPAACIGLLNLHLDQDHVFETDLTRAKTVLKTTPENDELLFLLGRAEQNRGHHEAAATYFRSCLAQKPDDLRIFICLLSLANNNQDVAHLLQPQSMTKLTAIVNGVLN